MSHTHTGDASGIDLTVTHSITSMDDTDPAAAATYNTPDQQNANTVEAIRPRVAGLGEYGDGSDGAATFDGSTAVTGWTRVGSTYTATRHTYFTNAAVSTGVTLVPSGFGMWVNGTLTLTGTAAIDASGANASGQTGGAIPASGIWYGGAGANGGNASTNGANSSLSNCIGGAGGAGHSSDDGHTAGTVTATAPTVEKGSIRTPASFACGMLFGSTGVTVPAAGCGGSGGAGGNGGTKGGGGGAGGGWLFVMARIISASASCNIFAKGGNGANGETSGGFAAGGGGGGGGGVVLLGYNQSTGAASPGTRISVAGGTGGGGLGTATSGSSGLSIVRSINP